MLDSIEKLHDRGYIHRDIKPSNFVMGKGKFKNKVYMVDFGLAKLHLDMHGIEKILIKLTGNPIEQRQQADFRGTVTYASLNAHNKIVWKYI
jgi:serine/threonine protein kinase